MKVGSLKAYGFLIRNSFKENNQSLLTLTISLTQPAILIAGYALFYSYITRAQSGGISNELIIYYLFITIIATLDVPRFGSYIQGDIQSERYLMIDQLPLSPFLYYLMNSLGKSLAATITYSIIVLLALIYLGVPLLTILLFLPSLVIAFTLAHLVTFLFATNIFYFEQMHMWLFSIIFEFLSGKMIPLALIPATLSFLLTWIIPFGFASGTLARFLSTQDYSSVLIGIIIALIWIAILFHYSHKRWVAGSRYFQENG